MSNGPSLRPATPKAVKKVTRKPSAAADSLTVNVILDTKARREYPSALTHAEVKCPSGSTIKFILDALKEELGTSVPVIGIRRLKDSEQFAESTEIASILTAGETVVAYCEAKVKPKVPSPRGAAASSRDKGPPARSGPTADKGSSSRFASPGRPKRSGSKDPLTRMSDAGRTKTAALRDKERKAVEIKSAADEQESKKFAFAPKTNVVSKRKHEERLAKEKQRRKGGPGSSSSSSSGGGAPPSALALLLKSGGWKGELPLPNSYDQAAQVVAVFVVTSEDGYETSGYLRLLPHGDLAGPEGLVVKWSAWAEGQGPKAGDDDGSVQSSRGSSRGSSLVSPKSKKGQQQAPSVWDMDLHFPPSVCAGPVPALLRSSNPQSLELAFPLGEKDDAQAGGGGGGAFNPAGLFGGSVASVLRPSKVEWPNQIMSLALVPPADLEPPAKKNLKLGTSLKNVAMSIMKEVKKLMDNALKAPSGRRLAAGEKKALVVVRLWNIRVQAKIDVDPFWSVTKLRVGLARLYERFPPLQQPFGEMCDPVWLAQAMEDEKDGRLRDRVVDTLEELVRDLPHCELTYEDCGEHTPRLNEDTEVFWFTGNSNAGLGSPLGAYLATEPDGEGVRRLRLNWLADTGVRPGRPCDLARVDARNGLAANAGLPAANGLEDLGPTLDGIEKGGRGKLIMAAERNKKALEDGSYGSNPGGVSYSAGQAVLGRGRAALQAPAGATVNDMRVLKLEMNQGRSLVDEEYGSKAEQEAFELQAKRQARLASSDPASVRAARMKAVAKRSAFFGGDDASKPKALTANASLAHAHKQSALIEMKMRRLQLHTAVGVNASRKRSRPCDVAREAKAEVELLSGVHVVTDPGEKRRLRERMLAARKRKLMDFLPSAGGKAGGGGGNTSAADASAAAASGKMEAPLGGGKEMSEEEKEMLAILKGINTSSSDKFANGDGNSGGDGGEGSASEGPKVRQKIKDYRKKGEIAKMRLAVILGDSYAEAVAKSKKVTIPAAKRE